MTGVARPPVPVTLDPPRGQIPTVSVVLATDPSTAAAWVAEALAAGEGAVALSLVDGAFSCRESLGAVARGLCDRAVRAGALGPDDVPVWANAVEIPAGSPLHPATGRKLFRRG